VFWWTGTDAWMNMMPESSTLQSVCHDYFDFSCDGDQKWLKHIVDI